MEELNGNVHRRIYSVRAKHEGERAAFDIARGELVCLIGSDSRTARRFEQWAQMTGADAAVAELEAYMESVAPAERPTRPHRPRAGP